MERGYTLVTDATGRLVTDPAAVAVGDHINTRFSRGSLNSEVIEVHTDSGKAATSSGRKGGKTRQR
jgi:exonuclease VII large subunit